MDGFYVEFDDEIAGDYRLPSLTRSVTSVRVISESSCEEVAHVRREAGKWLAFATDKDDRPFKLSDRQFESAGNALVFACAMVMTRYEAAWADDAIAVMSAVTASMSE